MSTYEGTRPVVYVLVKNLSRSSYDQWYMLYSMYTILNIHVSMRDPLTDEKFTIYKKVATGSRYRSLRVVACCGKVKLVHNLMFKITV